jgi:hypothetical protein
VGERDDTMLYYSMLRGYLDLPCVSGDAVLAATVQKRAEQKRVKESRRGS